MIKRILGILICIFGLCVLVKCTSDKDVGDDIIKIAVIKEKKFNKAEVGDTLSCVMCQNVIVKTKDNYPFCCAECEEKYHKVIEFGNKANTFIAKCADICRDVGDKVINKIDEWGTK